MSRGARGILAIGLALAVGGCTRPSWMRMPDVDLPDLPEVSLPDVDLPEVALPSFGGGDEDGAPEPLPDSAVEVVSGSAPEAAFHERASRFYGLLTGRRFNSIATFRDAGLREFFESDQSFSDYFADLAQDLDDAHFERNRPVRAEVEGFSVEGPGVARVQVVLGGEDDQPLRFWSTSLAREDRWERRDGRWWIVPGPL